MPFKKPLIIYHGNCADGFSAAWVFYHEMITKNDSYDFHAGVYGQTPPDVTDRDVYLVDFSYQLPVVETMLESAKSIILIDHHKTSIENLAPLINSDKIEHHIALDRSGAMLAWEYVFPDIESPELLKYVQDRDLWKFELPWSREVSAALFSYEYDFVKWEELMMNPDAIEELAHDGAAIERKHFKDIKELLGVMKHYRFIGDYNVPVANMPYIMSSDAASMLAEGTGTFGACYFDRPDGRVYSLRSVPGGLDVALIAQQYGGGGHKHAAGFTIQWGDKKNGNLL